MKSFIKQSFVVFAMPVTEGLRLGDMSGNEPLPEAIYPVRIQKTEIKRAAPSQQNPDPWDYANIALVVVADDRVDEQYHGRYIFDGGTLQPGKNWAVRQLLEAVGVDEDEDVIVGLRNNAYADRQLLVAVKIDPGGKGNDGKEYGPRNRVTKRIRIDA